MMAKPNLLITGATGYVGFCVLVTALEAGYTVRCVVRSQSKADDLLAHPLVARFSPQKTPQFVVVSDFTVSRSFDQCIEGLSYAIHVASPVPGPAIKDWQRDLIEPAVKGTLGVLESAARTSNIKRMVITSSVAGIVPYEALTHGDKTDKIWTADDRIPIDRGPYQNVVQAYNASKAMTLEAIADFVEKEKPSFEVVNVFPGWVIGRDDLAKDPKGAVSYTNWAALGHVFGHQSTRATAPIVGHVKDVARAHILALDSPLEGKQNFGVCFNSDWSEAFEIVQRNFPQAVQDGTFPNNGSQPNVKLNFDSSETERVLRLKLADFESQVVSVAKHYLEELAKPGARPVNPDGLQI